MTCTHQKGPRILIIQENGRHDRNRLYRECFALQRAFRTLGVFAQIWGFGHSGFNETPKFSDFDTILNLENYDDAGWLPDLSKIEAKKLFWAVDEHCRGSDYFRRITERDQYDFILHSTRDYVLSNNDIWFPNCFDDILIRPIAIEKRADVGFCGNVNNRGPYLEVLKSQFNFIADIGVIGESMVHCQNSYRIAFNRNIANDINARSFEVIGCGIPLVTNENPQYKTLGFEHGYNCMLYDTPHTMTTHIKLLLDDKDQRDLIAERGYVLAQRHTFRRRAEALLELLNNGPRYLEDLWQLDKKALSLTGNTPSISLCILTNSGLPSQNHRVEYLSRLLRSVEISGIPRSQLQVVISGAIPDSLKHVEHVDRPDLASAGQVSKLRNLAINRSNGDIIIHCDDDVIFCPEYWRAISGMLDADWDILCTRLLNPNGTRYWDWAAYYPEKGQTLLPYNVTDTHVYATGGHGIYKRHVFNKVRWDETIYHGGNEEFAFAAQARIAGLKYAMCPDATVFLQYHHCDANAAISGAPLASEKYESAQFVSVLRKLECNAIVPNDTPNTKMLERIKHKFKPVSQHADRDQEPEISVLTCCYRYLKRFRIYAESLCRQHFNMRKLEVIVANPYSDDGLSSYLNELADSCTQRFGAPVFREVLIDAKHFRNRGLLIQAAFENSQGKLIIGMDCDLILPPSFLAILHAVTTGNPDRVVGINRNFLTPETTNAIIENQLEPFSNFETLLSEDQQEEQGYRGVLGYCQAVPRTAWQKVGYPVEFDEISKSDVAFIERLASIDMKPLFLQDLKALHLHHRRNWMGTEEFL